MPISLKAESGGGGGVPIGGAVMLPDSAASPLFESDGQVFLRSGFLLKDEQVAYPDLFARYTPTFYKWTNMSHDQAPAVTDWWGLINVNGLLVKVGGTSSAGICATSTDGESWTLRTIPVGAWRSITYGNGLFVAVGLGGICATSPDGITWTSRTMPSANQYQSVTYGNGLFVAVGPDGGTASGNCATSPDGITWTARTMPKGSWYGVAYGHGMFVAVDSSGGGILATSLNGASWSTKSIPAVVLNAITFANDTFVAVGGGGLASTDGITWSSVSVPGSAKSAVAYGAGMFMTIFTGGSATSLDGITWTSRASQSETRGLAFWVDRFVAHSTYCHLNQIGFSTAYAQGSSVQYMRVK